ncbi:MAG: ATP-binding protein [Clostridiales bacterium]|nr:ATP-binding protein [Clostridiales bacterium]MCF8021314.1 ATP-binding protein [Clostridiales bacterium]
MYTEKVDKLQAAVEEFESYYNRRRGEVNQLQQQRKEAQEQREKVHSRKEMLQQVKILFQESSNYAREQARQQIQHMVTQALQYTFGPEISFEVELVEKRGNPEAEFYVVSIYGAESVKTRPDDARGGGVVDVISMALRMSLLETSIPPLPGPLLLDEPGKHVSDQFAPNLAHFIKSLSEAFSRQVLMVTHNRHFAETADKVYHVELVNGKSSVHLD